MRTNPTPAPLDDDEPVGGRSTGVFDLDAAVADAMGDVFPFVYKGEEWEMTHPGSVDYRDAEAADGGDVEAVRVVIAVAMGAERRETNDGVEYVGEQWAEFDRLEMPTVGLDRLFRAWLQHYGVKPGELPGSAARFGGTAAPSNRASRRSGSSSPRSSRRAGGGTSRR